MDSVNYKEIHVLVQAIRLQLPGSLCSDVVSFVDFVASAMVNASALSVDSGVRAE